MCVLFSLRILPHHQNTGGFFVAVLVKKSSIYHGINDPPKVMSSRTAGACCVAFLSVEAKAACGVCLKGGVQWGVLVCVVMMVSLHF